MASRRPSAAAAPASRGLLRSTRVASQTCGKCHATGHKHHSLRRSSTMMGHLARPIPARLAMPGYGVVRRCSGEVWRCATSLPPDPTFRRFPQRRRPGSRRFPWWGPSDLPQCGWAPAVLTRHQAPPKIAGRTSRSFARDRPTLVAGTFGVFSQPRGPGSGRRRCSARPADGPVRRPSQASNCRRLRWPLAVGQC